jgi:protein-disulfide isomerase
MKRRLLLGALAAASAAAAPLAMLPAQPAKAPAKAQQDWTRTVVQTAEGGYRMGSPNAPVKLVEFVSLTCPACATFSRSAMPQLRNLVRSGRVSFELRNFVLNPIDLAASMLSRCAPPQHYFALNEELMASQAEWTGRARNLSQAQLDEVNTLPDLARIARLAELTGIDRIAARHGVPAERARACLADRAGLERLVAMRQAGDALGVHGTPSFMVNGRMVEPHDWAGLEPLLRPPGR